MASACGCGGQCAPAAGTDRMRQRKEKQSSLVAVGALLSGARVTAAKRARLGVDPAVWRRAVGAKIDENTGVGELRRGVLEVRVASAAWAQELSFHVPMILRRLRDARVAVESLRFRVDASWKTSTPKAKVTAPLRPPIPLPEPIAARLQQVDDAGLRSAIAEAISHWLAFTETTSPQRAAPALRPAAPKSDPPDRTPGPRRAKAPHKNGAGRG